MLRRLGKIDKAVEELCAMLDTFYTEVEGWLELADIYASCQQYAPRTSLTSPANSALAGISMLSKLSHMRSFSHPRTQCTCCILRRLHTLCPTSL